MAAGPALIVIGLSARALAASACRAGFAPLSIDVFGDDDTVALSMATIRVGDDLARGLSHERVLDAVASMVDRFQPIGLVYGSGFEDRAEILESIGGITTVIGNSATAIRRAKDPIRLGCLCTETGIAHPDILESAPAAPEGWLRKKHGGSGGTHVRPADAFDTVSLDHYFQRRVLGEPYSALFLADGQRAQLVGFSGQWASPTPAQPFRFGGVCGPISLEAANAASAARAIAELVGRLGLVGLNGADFIVAANETWLIEINPRPGASLEVFDSTHEPLLAAHIAACAGSLKPLRSRDSFTAVETVYALLDTRTRAGFTWPYWAADRSPSGTLVRPGEPFCTVVAEGTTLAEARSLAERRSCEIIALAGEAER